MSMILKSFFKDPNELLDYAIDWDDPEAPWLVTGDTITASAWTAPSGITASTSLQTFTTTTATVWVSAGTAGQEYILTNRVTTTGGRIGEASIKIVVKETS